MEYTHLRFSKPSLAVMYSGLDLQSLYVTFWRLSARFSAKFDKNLATNLTKSALSLFCVLRSFHFLVFLFEQRKLCFSQCFLADIQVSFKFFCLLVDYKMVVKVWLIMEYCGSFFWCLRLQILLAYICLYICNDFGSAMIFPDTMKSHKMEYSSSSLLN